MVGFDNCFLKSMGPFVYNSHDGHSGVLEMARKPDLRFYRDVAQNL